MLNIDCRAHKFDNLYVVDTNVPNAALMAMADAPASTTTYSVSCLTWGER